MSNRKNDIERYLKGEMTPSEMHEMEKEALNDPFLSEALEGAHHAGADSFLFDLKELRSSFQHRTKRHQPQVISLWKWSIGIAAGLVLLAVSSVYIIVNINQEKSLAMEQQSGPAESNEQATLTDSSAASQRLSLNTPPPQVPSSEEKRTVAPQEKKTPQVPAQPSAQTGGEAEENRIEPVAQTEATDRKPQRIVEADLTEVPKGIASKKDADDKAEQKAAAEETPSVSDKRAKGIASRIIRGKVITEEDKVVVPGVNVLIKGTSKGTVTDLQGSYEIAVDDPKQILVFAFIGYKTTEVISDNKTELNIQLRADDLALSEVVVTGSGLSSRDNYPAFELAEPEGGRDTFQDYLRKNVRYPQAAVQSKVEGRVTVQFTVDINGQLTDFKVLKGIGSGCDEELIRLIKEGPAWSPTKQNSQPLSDKVKVRFRFDIPE